MKQNYEKLENKKKIKKIRKLVLAADAKNLPGRVVGSICCKRLKDRKVRNFVLSRYKDIFKLQSELLIVICSIFVQVCIR